MKLHAVKCLLGSFECTHGVYISLFFVSMSASANYYIRFFWGDTTCHSFGTYAQFPTNFPITYLIPSMSYFTR